ncbi:MAG: hypothetical protein IJ666_03800 [Ruminococcus sp.]|nr:hypothetical protein [Ruminococcus sp.]
MKKSGLFMVSAVLALISCGCAEQDKISQEEAADYLGQLYDRNFSLAETSENDSDICYIFTDEDGVQCHFFVEATNVPSSTEESEISYRITEDYQVMYLKAHPEYYQALSGMDMIPSWSEGDTVNSVRFTVMYNTYDDIESVVNKAAEAVSSVPKIESADNIANPPLVYSECAAIDFYCPYLSENSDVQMYFPMISKYVKTQSAEDIISQLQEHFNSEGVEYDDSWQKAPDFSTVPENYHINEAQPYDPDENRYNYGYYDEWSEYGYY